MTATKTSASESVPDLPDEDVGEMVVWITHGCGLEYLVVGSSTDESTIRNERSENVREVDESDDGVSLMGTAGYLAARHEGVCVHESDLEFEVAFSSSDEDAIRNNRSPNDCEVAFQ